MKNEKLAIKTFTHRTEDIDEYVNSWLRDNLDLKNVDILSMKYLEPMMGPSGRVYNTVVIEYKY